MNGHATDRNSIKTEVIRRIHVVQVIHARHCIVGQSEQPSRTIASIDLCFKRIDVVVVWHLPSARANPAGIGSSTRAVHTAIPRAVDGVIVGPGLPGVFDRGIHIGQCGNDFAIGKYVGVEIFSKPALAPDGHHRIGRGPECNFRQAVARIALGRGDRIYSVVGCGDALLEQLQVFLQRQAVDGDGIW